MGSKFTRENEDGFQDTQMSLGKECERGQARQCKSELS